MPDTPASIFPPLDFSRPRSISPTDIGAFQRLEGCERFLRLRLHTSNHDANWLRNQGLRKQVIPPLLTESGAAFERDIEAIFEHDHWTGLDQHHGAEAVEDTSKVPNKEFLAVVTALESGKTATHFQLPLQVRVGQWKLRGVMDMVQFTRDASGDLHILIADMKASQRPKVEHRLQLAFYHRMVENLLLEQGVTTAKIEFGVLYKGPENIEEAPLEKQTILRRHREQARSIWQLDRFYFELCEEATSYLNSLDKLVFNPDSQTRGIAAKPFDDLTFHLSAKCDACIFSEYCLRSAAEVGDLSLLPYLTPTEKSGLRQQGVSNVAVLAALKTPRTIPAEADDSSGWNELVTAPAHREVVAKLAGSREVGARLDELIHRAHAFTRTPGFKSYIPSKGEGTLPYVSKDVNSNIVRIYLDGGLDYVHNRAYLLGALLVSYQGGVETTRRTVVAITPRAPDCSQVEQDLIQDFLDRALSVAQEMALEAGYIDDLGEIGFEAPVHITFFDKRSQKIWLETLARHIPIVSASAPIFDFLKQLPSGDSFVVSTLDAEARALKNFPLLAPSLQGLARYLKFDWGDFTTRFRRGLFDEAATLDEGVTWYSARSRFSSQIPLEYAYGAWNILPTPQNHDDLFEGFRAVRTDDLEAFCARRLEAIEHIGRQFRGNTKTVIRPYNLDSLINFGVKNPSFVDALQTFLLLERLAELGAWKTARHAPPERRVLAGDSLLVRYVESDQEPENAARNRKNREVLTRQKAYRIENPKGRFPKEFNSTQTEFEFPVRLRIDTSGCDCSLSDALAMMTLREGDFIWLLERETTDSRLAPQAQVKFHPTVRQLLTWSKNATLTRGPHTLEGYDGLVFIEVETGSSRSGDGQNFTFGGQNCVFEDGEIYSVDPTPNDWTGSASFKTNQGIERGDANFMHDLLSRDLLGEEILPPTWPPSAVAGQLLFLEGIDHLAQSHPGFRFEASKRQYIGQHGGAPLLLVQGPPGTGKTYATAYALLARLQGAMAAEIPWRGLITAHTHAAVNVALRDVFGAIETLRDIHNTDPDTFKRYFDTRLLELPLFRLQGTSTDFNQETHLQPLWCDAKEAEKYESAFIPPHFALLHSPYCVAGGVPSGVRKIWKTGKNSDLGPFFNVMIVDEASQMNQPLACLAAVAHQLNSTLIVVGDPRQMPPITKHEWETESHRVFNGQPAFESLYAAALAQHPPIIKFEESFRLHSRMALFLKEAIYRHDDINYHSRRTATLPVHATPDAFLTAALDPDHPIVLLEHEEAASILENELENQILRPILERLTDMTTYALDSAGGLGIVVPHRAQRARLADTRWKVDTVERFQGDQRRVMAFSATESDPMYLMQNGGFLFDPRRLCVSLSRAKEKLILVASRSIFDTVPLDEETFLNAQLWQKLRDDFCRQQLWQGEVAGVKVTLRGSGL